MAPYEWSPHLVEPADDNWSLSRASQEAQELRLNDFPALLNDNDLVYP